MSQPFGNWEDAVVWLRQQPDQQALVTAAYYDDPLPAAAARYAASEEWQAIRPLLGPHSGKALDVGAGRGIASYALSGEGFAVTALEPDASAVVGAAAIRQLAHETGREITVVENFSEQLPFADASFDVVFARAVLHHCKDLPAACREFYRVLKPGGRLVAVREHVISRVEHLPAFLAAHPLHRYYGGEHAYLLADYRAALQAAGFGLQHELRPLRAVVNYFPHTESSLKDELCARLPLGGALLRRALSLPPLWRLTRWFVEQVDHRPGRHYSFVAVKS